MRGGEAGQTSPPGPLTGQSRTDGARCGAALAGHLSNIWRGGVGWGAGGVLARDARTRGGARPRVGQYLDGKMHLMGGGTGFRVDQGVGSGRSAGQDSLAQPVQAGQQGYGGAGRGTQTVMARRPRRNGEGAAMTRCPRGGTQTVLTRRPGRGGRGYVSTRCRRSGTQAAMPRRAQGGAGSFMTRCPRLGGVATVVR